MPLFEYTLRFEVDTDAFSIRIHCDGGEDNAPYASGYGHSFKEAMDDLARSVDGLLENDE